MAVAFDAAGTEGRSGAAQTTFDYTGLTVGVISNGALGVLLMFDSGGVSGVAAHWDSAGANQAMTSIGTVSTPGGRLSQAFGLVAPVAGNKTLHLNWTGAAEVYVVAVSWSGVDQTGGGTTFKNYTSQSASTSTPSITVTSAVGDAVMGSHQDDNTITSLTGTAIWANDNTGPNIAAGASRFAGASPNVTFAMLPSKLVSAG